MQYILTQEEFDELNKVKQHKFDVTTKQLQKLCTKIANEMPVTWGWGGPDPKPWGCIHTRLEDDNEEWYCDECPVKSICPSTKNWSK